MTQWHNYVVILRLDRDCEEKQACSNGDVTVGLSAITSHLFVRTFGRGIYQNKEEIIVEKNVANLSLVPVMVSKEVMTKLVQF